MSKKTWFIVLGVVLVVVIGNLVLLLGHGGPSHTVASRGRPTPSPSLSPSPTPSPSPSESPVATSTVTIPTASLVVYSNGPAKVPVYSAPDTTKALAPMDGHNSIGQPAAFLVLQQTPGWYQVVLPIQPNGSTGWIPAGEVQTTTVPDFLLVSLSQFSLYYYSGGQLQATYKVGVGKPSTPTPTGLFYVWGSQTASSPYTPGIFALSGYTLQPVPGFLGARVGVHGWTDPSVQGQQVSNGCVRVPTAEMNGIIHKLLLGTPVEIVA